MKMFDAGKTRMIGLPYCGKNCDDMLSRFHLIPERHGQTDGRTDGQTDRRTDRQTDLLYKYRASVCARDIKMLLILWEQFCKSRNDDWEFTVRGRVELFGGYLHAADSVYHKSCDVNFRTFCDIRRQHKLAPESKRKLGGQLTVTRNKLFARCVPTLRRMMKNS